MTGADAGGLGRVFNEVPELYDRTRPTYPNALFADLAEITGLVQRSHVLEAGCGTGQATRSLAPHGCQPTAVEPGDGLAALARQRLAAFGNVSVESSAFEDWDDRGRRFDVLVAASSWHWVDPATGWRKARDVLSPGRLEGPAGQRHDPRARVRGDRRPPRALRAGQSRLGASATGGRGTRGQRGVGPAGSDPGGLFGPTTVRWYPHVLWFDGAGHADYLRTMSMYRKLSAEVREALLDAIAERIRTRLDDRVPRRYLSMLRVGQRAD